MREYLPTLYKLDSKNKPRFWKVYVEPINEGVKLGTESGMVNGKVKDHFVLITSGKNLGRANATTPYTQAKSEAESMFTIQQTKKGYVLDLDDFKREGAMLAHKFEEHGDKLPEVFWVQPKLNGVRVRVIRTEQGLVYQSRGNKLYTNVPERITNALMVKMRPGQVVDAELFIPGLPLRHITSAVKAFNPTYTPRLQLHIFDIVLGGAQIFSERYTHLQRAWGPWWGLNTCGIFLVEACLVTKKSQYQEKRSEYVRRGYEGIMARDPYAAYEEGIRSYSLQKDKPIHDTELDIIRVEIDREGCGMPIVSYQGGPEFPIRLMGDHSLRVDMGNNPEQYIGKRLTVAFQSVLESGILEFARGELDDDDVVIRDYE